MTKVVSVRAMAWLKETERRGHVEMASEDWREKSRYAAEILKVLDEV